MYVAYVDVVFTNALQRHLNPLPLPWEGGEEEEEEAVKVNTEDMGWE